MEGRELLSFDKEKVQTLSMDMLKRTYKENDVYGKPLKGMYHHEVIERCAEVAMNAGLQLVINEIFAAQNRDRMQPGVVLLPEVEKQYGERAIEAHILRRVFCNMELHDYDTDEFTTNLVVAFHQDGIQVAFGPKVKACHNQCIMHREMVFVNYGKNKANSFNELFGKVGEWMENSRNLIMRDMEIIGRMKQQEILPHQVLQIIGDLTARRVAHDTKHDSIRITDTYPLNQAQISMFTEKLLLTMKKNDRISVWDVYDAATHIYKPTYMEIPNILPQNAAMSDYLIENWVTL